jgi:hypothetical protein
MSLPIILNQLFSQASLFPMSTSQPQPQSRSKLIEKKIQDNNLKLIFKYNLIPAFEYDNGFSKYIIGELQPGGFSLIGFFLNIFAFAYIKTYKIFWLWGGLRVLFAVFELITRADNLYIIADLFMTYCCAVWYPYHQYRLKVESIKPDSIGNSIIIAIILGFIACSPAIVIEIIGQAIIASGY